MKLRHLWETDETGDYHVNQSEPDLERRQTHVFVYMKSKLRLCTRVYEWEGKRLSWGTQKKAIEYM